MSTAAHTTAATAATSTGLSERFEAGMHVYKEIAIQDIVAVMNMARWGGKPQRRDRCR